MSMFKEMLRSGETLFRDTIALDYDYQPKVLKFREAEQQRFAIAIRPLLQNHNGRHLFVYGAPGIGSTPASWMENFMAIRYPSMSPIRSASSRMIPRKNPIINSPPTSARATMSIMLIILKPETWMII